MNLISNLSRRYQRHLSDYKPASTKIPLIAATLIGEVSVPFAFMVANKLPPVVASSVLQTAVESAAFLTVVGTAAATAYVAVRSANNRILNHTSPSGHAFG